MRGELAAALHRVNSRLPEARERVACVHWDFAKHMTRRGGGGGGGGGVKEATGSLEKLGTLRILPLSLLLLLPLLFRLPRLRRRPVCSS